MSGAVVCEYHAPWPDKVEPGRGLVAIFVETEEQRLVLLADTPWNRGASMTNAIEAIIKAVVKDVLEPRGIDWRSVNFVELDSEGCFDIPRFSGAPHYLVSWSPLVAVNDAHVEQRRTEKAFLAGFGALAETAIACFRSLSMERMQGGDMRRSPR
ncbi:MAG TPA: hypothetical protein PLZ79_12030 [Burkholderiales bacterium]|nr:hypothetical protein [Burkholderiales bacterium]